MTCWSPTLISREAYPVVVVVVLVLVTTLMVVSP